MTKLIINNIFSPIDIISLEAICPFLKWPYFLVSWFDRDVSTCSTFNCKFQTVHFQTFNIINKATKKNSKQKNHKPTPYLSPTHKLKHLLFFLRQLQQLLVQYQKQHRHLYQDWIWDRCRTCIPKQNSISMLITKHQH